NYAFCYSKNMNNRLRKVKCNNRANRNGHMHRQDAVIGAGERVQPSVERVIAGQANRDNQTIIE
ncbi:MAG: hypothetical protein K2N77_06685, partial [Lachnospiraceae bacterium]|nr:hypothetical protein [Lachnospiraceae bacterium]